MMSFMEQRAAREDAAAEEAKKDKEARTVRDERMLKSIETSSNAVNMLVNWMMSADTADTLRPSIACSVASTSRGMTRSAP